MHELSVATSILAAVAGELSRPGTPPPRRLVVKVGQISGIDAGSLEFCFRVAGADSPLAGLEISVQRVPAALSCPACGEVPAVDGFALACPRCGGRIGEVRGGRDLEVFLETEDPDEDRPEEADPRGQ
jgi:hydrogenase nickel incorporation protein HypA/HybF